MFKGMETLVLSETLVQNIVGVGFPSAEHFKVNSAGAVMVRLAEIMLLGEAGKIKCLNTQRLPNKTQEISGINPNKTQELHESCDCLNKNIPKTFSPK